MLFSQPVVLSDHSLGSHSLLLSFRASPLPSTCKGQWYKLFLLNISAISSEISLTPSIIIFLCHRTALEEEDTLSFKTPLKHLAILKCGGGH